MRRSWRSCSLWRKGYGGGSGSLYYQSRFPPVFSGPVPVQSDVPDPMPVQLDITDPETVQSGVTDPKPVLSDTLMTSLPKDPPLPPEPTEDMSLPGPRMPAALLHKSNAE
ncbi:hypothetical protein DPEC_G00062960 [Dallia pectoralis]|uniref:Uncharacterized protein n=1 Tax=Dallia pectoralis TaxID=75939 RepID=A0ACC2H7Q6_DALPE|nr:hypothetical protein DPEC_G00062960 [Dallia pectoralis]